MDARFRLDGAVKTGEWDEGADPDDAFNEMMALGYDPNADYCVGGKISELIKVVHRGNLKECLEEASRRSTEGYFLVFRASDLSNVERVEIH